MLEMGIRALTHKEMEAGNWRDYRDSDYWKENIFKQKIKRKRDRKILSLFGLEVEDVSEKKVKLLRRKLSEFFGQGYFCTVEVIERDVGSGYPTKEAWRIERIKDMEKAFYCTIRLYDFYEAFLDLLKKLYKETV